ncbi:MAG: hypothetical protein ACI4NU_02150 [Christensenellales bacterium]
MLLIDTKEAMRKAGMVWPESIATVSDVAIPLNKIKDAVLATENVSTETPARAVRISIISLRDLFANINPADGNFLNYVPDKFLNNAQRQTR